MEASSDLGQTPSVGPVDKTSKLGGAMRLHRVLAATLAAFFVVGCSSEKSTSPIALASTGPKEKPSVEPSRETVDPALPPKADPAPATETASPPAPHEDPAKETDEPSPPPPPDPYASVRGVWVSIPEQVEELLEPVVKAALHSSVAIESSMSTKKKPSRSSDWARTCSPP